MATPDVQRELIVFPTELALRRFQQEEALAAGIVDASGHLTFARLRSLCLPHARLKGRRMSPARQLLMRQQVVEVARGHFAGEGALGELSDPALADVLDQLVREMAVLPEEAARIVDWLLDRPRGHKLYQLGTLFSVWRAMIQQDGWADALDVNLSLLRLLKGNRAHWPPLLRNAKRIVFRSVRWFNPFEEACVDALNQTLKVVVESALPTAHAEWVATRLGQRIPAGFTTTPWVGWVEGFGDAMMVESRDLVDADALSRIGFSRSSGAYGEIEDLARRICRACETEGVAPNRIALVVPNLGAVQDIVPHVFSRFRIPYYFRRGRPVLSSPCVKALVAWLSFPLHGERDVLIDLARNPAVRIEDRQGLVDRLATMPPRLRGPAAPVVSELFPDRESISGMRAAEMLKARIVEPEDHFNMEALKALRAALEGFGDQSLPLGRFVDLMEELLENATVKPKESHEQGVWILNPHDAVGLEFDWVLFAGLNEGEFPSTPLQDALLGDSEREWLRQHLEGLGRHLPGLALRKSDIAYAQQTVLFYSTIGMARQRLVFSYQSVDQEGNEKSPSAYFRKAWDLAGWCADDGFAPDGYDRWRMDLPGTGNVFARHVEAQRRVAPEDRIPMPGESFLSIVPLPLCRAEDEALQAVLANPDTGPAPASQASTESKLAHLAAMLEIESERERFLDTPEPDRAPSRYCGFLASMKERVAEWFSRRREIGPTALEKLAQCRYLFLLEQVFGIRDARVADDMPDPLDRGRLVHSLLKEIYATIASGESGIDLPRFWAAKTAAGWMLRREGGVDCLPLAVFDPAAEEEYMGFARRLAERRLGEAVLGHPGVWGAEREKLLQVVLNLVRHDVLTAASENRYPALFEQSFGGDTAVELEEIRLKGMVDRIDLIFAGTGELQKIRVLDYKGPSRQRNRRDDYLEEIRRNLDCQLPVYAFAAQRRFFGDCNTPELNGRVEAGYLFQQREFAKIGSSLAKCLVSMDEPGLVEEFLSTLSSNIRRLKNGDFSVDPLIAPYNVHESICRTIAVDPKELDRD